MTKMASHESSEGPRKSPIADKVNTTIESKTNEVKPTASLSVDRHDELNDTAADTKEKNLTLNTTADCVATSVEKNDSDDIKSESKELKPLVIDKQDNTKTDKKQETQNVDSLVESQTIDKGKEVKSVDSKNSVKKGETLKRKRRTLNKSTMVESSNSPTEESSTRGKRKKLKTGYDQFCWRCHKENVDAYCTACPRSYHRKCIGGMPSSLDKWICGECATILKAENAETRSVAMAQLSIDQLCMLLKHVVERLRDYPGSEPFCKPVDLVEVPNYLEYVIKPMDLNLLESNVRAKLYGSTDAFMADAKWIQHNCIVFNTCGGVYADTSKLTNAAKQIIKVTRQEISEIDACPDCYAHGRNLPRPQPSWFIEPCRRPHPLVWAKLKGFPFWPAKAMPRTNSQGYVDVRFFGEHDRAWVSPKDLFLYSEEPPAPSPRKRKSDMDECVKEITRHCRKLALMFGQFKFAPPKIQYDPNNPLQIRLMLPNYNPLEPKNHLPNPKIPISQKKKSLQKRQSSLKGKSQSDELTNISEIDIDPINDACEKENEATSLKVQKLNTDVKDTSSSQTDLDDSIKLNKKADQEIVKSVPQEVAQNKTVKNGKSSNTKTSTSRLNIAHTETDAENNSISPNVSTSNNSTSSNVSTSNNSINSNASISNENNSQKLKNEVKSFIKILPKPANYPVTDAVAQKKTLLKNIINPKVTFSQADNSKIITKYTRNNKAFKLKTSIVDKLNAEKELMSLSASKEDEKLSNSSKVIPRMSLLNNSKESLNVKNIPEVDITLSSASNASVTHTITSTNPVVPITDKSVLLLVVPNGKSTEPAKQVASTIDFNQGNNEGYTNSPQKAKKSFPRSNLKNIQRSSNADGIMEISSIGQETPSTYQLPPPEAGPISARLHHDAHELARKMGHLMEEAYKEAAQNSINGENGTTDNYQATIFFLRKQIEHMKWQHQQQLAELKHNADRTLREMRASMEAEKSRSIEEVRKEIEDEKIRCIEETKKKQWCAKCGQEAMFYCCWNTAYCNYPCQESHWPTHMRTCSQQSAYATIVSSSANLHSNANLNSQQTSYVIADNSATKTYLLSSNMKLSAIPSASSVNRNKTSQDTL